MITMEKLIEIGQLERKAVIESDFIVILLPGGNGTHIELGIVSGQKKKIFFTQKTKPSTISKQQVHFITYQK